MVPQNMEFFASIASEAIWYGLEQLIEFGLAKKLFSCPIRDQSEISVYESNRMVMDGDISPMLITQSTVMDDNKVLTLTNNDIIDIMTIATEDTTLFMGLVDDLFLALDVPRKRELEFRKQVCQATVDLQLQHKNNFILKVVQLVELLEVRHSVFIIGVAGTGKTEVWKTLYRTYGNLTFKPHFNEIEPYTAVTNDEFFGVINTISRTFVDELFSCLIRHQSQMSVYGTNRMVMDGDISPMWTSPPENAYGTYYFVFTCLSAFGSAIFQDQLIDWRVEISKWWLTEFKTIKISSSGSVFNYFIDPEPNGPSLDIVSSFELNPDIHLQQTLVSTIETTRKRYFLNLLVDKKIMFAGADDDIFKSLSNDLYAVANVPLNFYTISEMLHKILEKPLEKKAGRKFGLPDGKSLICFIDDINMPEQTLVSTIETTRTRYFLNLLVDKKILLAGADDDIFKSLSNDLYAVANVPLNFYTISEMLQKILEKPLEKKAKFLVDGKTLINCIEDINMPEGISPENKSVFTSSLEPVNDTSGPICHAVPQDVSDSCINESAQTRSVGSNIVQKAMKKLPKNLGDYHPVQLLNQLLPGLQYHVEVISNPPADILVQCTIDELTFVGRAPSKKLAQREIAVCALAIFYG